MSTLVAFVKSAYHLLSFLKSFHYTLLFLVPANIMPGNLLDLGSQEQHEKIDKLRELGVAEDISLPQVCSLDSLDEIMLIRFSSSLLVISLVGRAPSWRLSRIYPSL